jgi:hypothetical protein
LLKDVPMKTLKVILLSGLLMFSTDTFAQGLISPGTIIPIRLNSSFSLKTKPGSTLTARVMQDVPVSTGAKIRAGTKIIGHVINVTTRTNGANGRVSFAFGTLMVAKRYVPITTNLRAMASFVEVEEAQVPQSGPDRGTPESAWTTVQLGGEINYRGGGPVMEGSNIVGKPAPDGVLSQLHSSPGQDCAGGVDGNDRPQALWVFSADACGMYGFPSMSIVHAGRKNPAGVIVLTSHRNRLRIFGGTGMLLRVTGGGRSAT